MIIEIISAGKLNNPALASNEWVIQHAYAEKFLGLSKYYTIRLVSLSLRRSPPASPNTTVNRCT